MAAAEAGYACGMGATFDPGPAPQHQCLNVICGCNDLVSAGPCSEWCSANTLEAADVERGLRPALLECDCGHDTCAENRTVRGTPERGLA